MRQIKEVLRLRFDAGLGLREIARACSIGLGTVHHYLKKAEAAGIKWPLPAEWDDDKLRAELSGSQPAQSRPPRKPLPDFAAIQEELRKDSNVTLLLLWEELCGGKPDGYSYSQFCHLYKKWKRKQDLVMRQDHTPGEKLFVDWAGATIPIYSRDNGEVRRAPLFVSSLGVSSCTYAEVAANQQLDSWISVQIHALEFYKGVPKLVIPDNTKTGVTKPCRYDPDLNPTYQEMSMHYGFGVLPARPYKPRDKAKVESAVQLAQRWIVAVLRNHRFFSEADANQAIQPLLKRLNERPFRKREGSRDSLFEQLDRPALRPLPEERFELGHWTRARVNIDYHIAFDTNFYSVPHNLVHELVEVRATLTIVEIFHKGQRTASHIRGRGHGEAITQHGHRPRSHQAHLEWPPSRMVSWAQSIGPNTAQLFERILAAQPHPEMGYRGCLGIIRLSKEYSTARVEAAAALGLATGACSYSSIKSILKNALDRQPANPQAADKAGPAHDNIRGPEYFRD